MAKMTKNRKSMSNRAKSVVTLALLLVVTLVVSYVGIAGLLLGPEQSRKLLPWMPVSGELEAYTLSRAYGDVLEIASTFEAAEGSEATLDDVLAALEDRFAAYGVRDAKLEKTGDATITATIPYCKDYDMIASLTGSVGQVEFRDVNGNVLLTNDDFASYKVQYSNGYHYLTLESTKEGKQRLTDATTATLNGTLSVYLDGVEMISPNVDQVNTQGVLTVSFGLTEDATRGLGAMVEAGALPMTVTATTMTLLENESAGALTAVLLVLWVVFVVACVYMVVRYRAAGLGAAWTLWAYMLLFFFLMGAVTLVLVDTAAWVCMIAGEVFVVCALLSQLKGMKQAVLAGRDAAHAVKLGLRTFSKQNLLRHAVLLAVAVVLMILNVTRPYGYILATVAVAGVCVSEVLVRALVPCLVSAVGGKSCAISGK